LIYDKIKVWFDLDVKDWHGFASESMWAEPLPNEVYGRLSARLLNSPFYVIGVSYRDIVNYRIDTEKNINFFVNCVARSGHSTYMVLFGNKNNAIDCLWLELQELGCTYEGANVCIKGVIYNEYSIDVPPNSDILRVNEILERGEILNLWKFQAGHVEHKIDPIIANLTS
jgi:Domain of unknown function (DUF4265)